MRSFSWLLQFCGRLEGSSDFDMRCTLRAERSQRDSVGCGTPLSRDSAQALMPSEPAMRATMRALNPSECNTLMLISPHSTSTIAPPWGATRPAGVPG